MIIGLLRSTDIEEWARLRAALWPDGNIEQHPEETADVPGNSHQTAVFVSAGPDGQLHSRRGPQRRMLAQLRCVRRQPMRRARTAQSRTMVSQTSRMPCPAQTPRPTASGIRTTHPPTIAASRCLEMKGPNILKGNFQPGFKIDLHYKDLGLTMETGRALGVPLPVTALVQVMFNALRVKDRGSLDHSAVITLLEDLASVQVRKS